MRPKAGWKLAVWCLAAVALRPDDAGPTQATAAQTGNAAVVAVSATDSSAVEHTAEMGPARVRVRAAPAPAKLSDRVVVTLEVDYPNRVDVQCMTDRQRLPDWLVIDEQQPLPAATDTGQRLTRRLVVEPLNVGELSLQPWSLTITDRRLPDQRGTDQRGRQPSEPHTEVVPRLAVDVATSLADAEPSLAKLEGPTGPVELESGAWWRGTWLLTGGLLVLLLAAAIVVGRRQRRRVVEPPLSPRQRARRELNELWETGFDRWGAKQFYIRLTEIVRRYLEAATGLHAPEQTTEEFLHALAARGDWGDAERLRLKQFLESADLVKFAAAQPRLADAEQSYRRAWDLVEHDRAEAAP